MGPVYWGQRGVCLRVVRALSARSLVGGRGDAASVCDLDTRGAIRPASHGVAVERVDDRSGAQHRLARGAGRRVAGRLHSPLRPPGGSTRSDRLSRADWRPVAQPAVARPDRPRCSKRLPASIVSGPVADGAANAFEAINRLRQIYCSTSGHDYNHVFVPDERVWLRQAVESGQFRPPKDPIHSLELLQRITSVETFEKFLHRTFPGKTRFSLEGLDMMVPILDEIISDAAAGGVKHVMIAMAHRGRLNVLVHILQKPTSEVLAEFKDPLSPRQWRIDLGWMGDVKYHAGARVETREGPASVVISMPPNPSHLEAVDPVLNGMARAAATSRRSRRARRRWTRARCSRSSFTATRPSRARASSPRRSISRVSTATTSAASSTSSPTTRSASPPSPTNRSARATPAAWRAGSRFRFSTSTPTIRWRASRRAGWPGCIAIASSSTS